MAVDEYEVIRLIDLEGLTQEQCAKQMEVARTTAQAIYASARKKLAECIVQGRQLKISGGDIQICPHQGHMGNHCRERYCGITPTKGGHSMRIAATYEEGQIFQHFGHTQRFKVYDVEAGKVKTTTMLDTAGSGHGALAAFLRNARVDTLICGGIGGGAKQALAQAGIQLYGGVSGDADKAVEDLLANRLAFNPGAECAHHGGHHHEDTHSCGKHSCIQETRRIS